MEDVRSKRKLFNKNMIMGDYISGLFRSIAADLSVPFFLIYLFYFILFLFLAALGLRCCVWAFSSCSEQGLLFVAE